MRGTYVIGSHLRYELVAELRDDGDGLAVVLVDRVAAEPAAAPGRSISVPFAALDTLVPYIEWRLGLAHPRTPGDPELMARYVAGLTMVAGQEQSEVSPVSGLYHGWFDRIVDWYTEAGVSHQEIGDWEHSGTGLIRREVLVRVRPAGDGYDRTLYVEIVSGKPRQPDRMLFHESYRLAGADAKAFQHTVEVRFSVLDPLVAVLEERLGGPVPESGDDPSRRLIAAFTALCERGELGEHLPYRRNRDRVHSWYAAAGMTCRLFGSTDWRDLIGVAALPTGDRLSLQVGTIAYEKPAVEFRQFFFPRGPVFKTIESTVRIPLGSLDGLVAFLERRLHLPAGPGTEDRLFACLTALVERGDLGIAPADGSAPPENAALVARLSTEAGIPCEFADKSTHTLLATYQESVACHLVLQLTVDTRTVVAAAGAPPARLVALEFDERHDYPRLADDPGREYVYSATLAPTPIQPLVVALERRLRVEARSPDLGERLVDCFRALVDRDELTGDLPLEANRDRVAAILRDLGELTTDSSVWVNSD